MRLSGGYFTRRASARMARRVRKAIAFQQDRVQVMPGIATIVGVDSHRSPPLLPTCSKRAPWYPQRSCWTPWNRLFRVSPSSSARALPSPTSDSSVSSARSPWTLAAIAACQERASYTMRWIGPADPRSFGSRGAVASSRASHSPQPCRRAARSGRGRVSALSARRTPRRSRPAATESSIRDPWARLRAGAVQVSSEMPGCGAPQGLCRALGRPAAGGARPAPRDPWLPRAIERPACDRPTEPTRRSFVALRRVVWTRKIRAMSRSPEPGAGGRKKTR